MHRSPPRDEHRPAACDDAGVDRSRDRSTLGLSLALLGVVLVPLTLLIVALLPDGSRVAGFLLGLVVVAVVAGRGGWIAKDAFSTGGPHPVRAFMGAVIGLGLAATAAIVCLWAAVGVATG